MTGNKPKLESVINLRLAVDELKASITSDLDAPVSLHSVATALNLVVYSLDQLAAVIDTQREDISTLQEKAGIIPTPTPRSG